MFGNHVQKMPLNFGCRWDKAKKSAIIYPLKTTFITFGGKIGEKPRKVLLKKTMPRLGFIFKMCYNKVHGKQDKRYRKFFILYFVFFYFNISIMLKQFFKEHHIKPIGKDLLRQVFSLCKKSC